MQRYLNRSGDSGVVAYELGPASIAVRFVDGSVYLYDARQPGAQQVDDMKRLAQAGRGLSGYISRSVQQNYARKLR
ncbi:hypothetical protein J2X20_003705 [Pelomonas saccharophila]|uniref:KTSC domain-containing protein n=1 Tax=Roseateles saccharophilus TaxID=304 RepID=A0ABU1YQB0_ROSSA|nr:hypothetical protein [Roseateles saccharophilus]MDR7271047.1 hypothetical protein [Roseateles saccharophilus]